MCISSLLIGSPPRWKLQCVVKIERSAVIRWPTLICILTSHLSRNGRRQPLGSWIDKPILLLLLLLSFLANCYFAKTEWIESQKTYGGSFSYLRTRLLMNRVVPLMKKPIANTFYVLVGFYDGEEEVHRCWWSRFRQMSVRKSSFIIILYRICFPSNLKFPSGAGWWFLAHGRRMAWLQNLF